jgi:hypothetical protein
MSRGHCLFDLLQKGTPDRASLVADFRSGLGRSNLLGLEFLAAADIINTVAVEPTIESLPVFCRHRSHQDLPELYPQGRDRWALALAERPIGPKNFT